MVCIPAAGPEGVSLKRGLWALEKQLLLLPLTILRLSLFSVLGSAKGRDGKQNVLRWAYLSAITWGPCLCPIPSPGPVHLPFKVEDSVSHPLKPTGRSQTVPCLLANLAPRQDAHLLDPQFSHLKRGGGHKSYNMSI